jgi:hypothetical protein
VAKDPCVGDAKLFKLEREPIGDSKVLVHRLPPTFLPGHPL